MIPVSGKLKFNGDIVEEMSREICEELSIPEDGFTMDYVDSTYLGIMEPKLYPNVPLLWYHSVFTGKIDARYMKNEYVEHQVDKSTFFKWLKNKPKTH